MAKLWKYLDSITGREAGSSTASLLTELGVTDGASVGFPYAFDTSTTNDSPGAGNLRFNSAAPASITEIYIHSEDGAGNIITGELNAIGTSTSTNKGVISIKGLNGAVYSFAITNITSTFHVTLSVTTLSVPIAVPSNDDEVLVSFVRNGDAGNDGADGSGAIAQLICTKDNTGVSTSSAIPIDNTIPQNTEGAEYTQIATTITPTSATSTIVVEINLTVYADAAHSPVACLFKDSGSNALATAYSTLNGSAHALPLTIKYTETAGSTSARTYKCRYGRNSTAPTTVYINQWSTARFGGTIYSSMTVTEVIA